ncbi:hypothetical protein [Paenibacillus sp. 1A_MP2]|uniref:hypothetical protein n=1 Tax=Paenibacillus sp. 1A_MP2 TaxID=3457495 RepID=UPI003FCE4DDA
MSLQQVIYPLQRTAHYKEWSPNVHYAQFQSLPPGKLAKRRLYDFELLYVSQGEAATYMNDKHHILKAGQLIMLPAGSITRMKWSPARKHVLLAFILIFSTN